MSGSPIDRPKASTHIFWVTHSYSRNQQIASYKFGKRHCNRQLVRVDGACATERERRDDSEIARERDHALARRDRTAFLLCIDVRESVGVDSCPFERTMHHTTDFYIASYWAPRASLLQLLSAKWLILHWVRQNLPKFPNASFDRSREDYKVLFISFS